VDIPLRHQTQQHVAIGSFLEALAWERVTVNPRPLRSRR
jgi:hypothetical protein